MHVLKDKLICSLFKVEVVAWSDSANGSEVQYQS
jgi:hypothetical protein